MVCCTPCIPFTVYHHLFTTYACYCLLFMGIILIRPCNSGDKLSVKKFFWSKTYAQTFTFSAPAQQKTPAVKTFKLGVNVVAKWGARKWFMSHVCAVKGSGAKAIYDVYCPGENIVKRGLTHKQLKDLDDQQRRYELTRAQFVKDKKKFSTTVMNWLIRRRGLLPGFGIVRMSLNVVV